VLQPFRMALSEISIRLQKTGSNLLVDDVFGQKVGTVSQQYDAATTILGQPRFSRMEDGQAGATGDLIQTVGHITISAKEISSRGMTPDQLKNARVVGYKRGHNAAGTFEAVNFLIKEVRPRGHLAGGPILYRLSVEKFKDEHGGQAV
jgi:hypothetical protein